MERMGPEYSYNKDVVQFDGQWRNEDIRPIKVGTKVRHKIETLTYSDG